MDQVTYKKINGLDELKQALDDMRYQLKSASGPQMFAKPGSPDRYFSFQLGNMQAYIGIHLAGGIATVRYNEVNEHNAPPGVRAIFKEFLHEMSGHKDKDFEDKFYQKYFNDKHQVTLVSAQRTYSAAQPLKGSLEEREAEAKKFVEGVELKPEQVAEPGRS